MELFLWLWLGSCSDDNEGPKGDGDISRGNELVPIELTLSQRNAVAGLNQMGSQLAGEVIVSRLDDNVAISPLSAGVVWAMLTNGADGETLESAAGLLGIKSSQLADLNSGCSEMLHRLADIDATSDVSINQAVWNNLGVLDDDYVGSLKEAYKPQVFDCQAKGLEKGEASINKWLHEGSGGQVTDYRQLVGYNPLNFAVFNTTSFKGRWTQGFDFDKKATGNSTFHGVDGASEVPMMYQHSKLTAVSRDLYTMVKLPMGNGAFSF